MLFEVNLTFHLVPGFCDNICNFIEVDGFKGWKDLCAHVLCFALWSGRIVCREERMIPLKHGL